LNENINEKENELNDINLKDEKDEKQDIFIDLTNKENNKISLYVPTINKNQLISSWVSKEISEYCFLEQDD
jgi:hypothetical protein